MIIFCDREGGVKSKARYDKTNTYKEINVKNILYGYEMYGLIKDF